MSQVEVIDRLYEWRDVPVVLREMEGTGICCLSPDGTSEWKHWMMPRIEGFSVGDRIHGKE